MTDTPIDWQAEIAASNARVEAHYDARYEAWAEAAATTQFLGNYASKFNDKSDFDNPAVVAAYDEMVVGLIVLADRRAAALGVDPIKAQVHERVLILRNVWVEGPVQAAMRSQIWADDRNNVFYAARKNRRDWDEWVQSMHPNDPRRPEAIAERERVEDIKAIPFNAETPLEDFTDAEILSAREHAFAGPYRDPITIMIDVNEEATRRGLPKMGR